MLGILALQERDRRLYVWLIGGRGARARGRRRGSAVVLCARLLGLNARRNSWLPQEAEKTIIFGLISHKS
jgi:hypothetical protein